MLYLQKVKGEGQNAIPLLTTFLILCSQMFIAVSKNAHNYGQKCSQCEQNKKLTNNNRLLC